jgi:hypothetical protein
MRKTVELRMERGEALRVNQREGEERECHGEGGEDHRIFATEARDLDELQRVERRISFKDDVLGSERESEERTAPARRVARIPGVSAS